MDNKFEPLAIGEVLSIDDSALILIGHHTFRVGEFAEAMRTQLEYNLNGWTQEKDAWFSQEGIPCEVLKFTAGGWQKGRVRINLEFCPQDSEEEENKPPSPPKAEKKVEPPAPEVSEDEFNLDESPFDSASLEEDIAPAALLDTEPDLGLQESPFDSTSFEQDISPAALLDTEPDFGLEESPFDSTSFEQDISPAALVDTEADFGLEESLLNTEADLDMEGFPMSVEDEFALETAADTDFDQEEEVPNAVIIEREQIIIMPAGNEMATSLEDNLDVDLGELSQSIDQELELVDAPIPSDEELLDLAEMSLEDNDDLDFAGMNIAGDQDFPFEEMSAVNNENLDFGEMSGMDDDFDFPELGLSDESSEDDNDALLDDVWQDINQPSWQNHQR